MTDKRILILCESFPPDINVGRERPWSFARHLPELGWRVEVVTRKLPERYDLYRSADPEMEKLLPANVRVHRVAPAPALSWMLAGKYRRKLVRIATGFPDSSRIWAEQCGRVACTRAKEFKPDIVLTTSPPNSIHLIGLRVVAATGCKWVADFQDAWVGNRLARQVTPLHTRASGRYYERVMRGCDLVVANNPWLRAMMLQQFPDLQEKIVSVPIGYDEGLYAQAQPHRVMEDPAVRVAMYSGGLYEGEALRALERLCTALDACAGNQTPEVRVYAVGELTSAYRPERRSGPFGLGYVNYTSVPDYLLGADCLILYMPEAERHSARVLLKAYGYARVQRPILYLGPPNATYEYLKNRAIVGRFESHEFDRAADWVMTLTVGCVPATYSLSESVREASFGTVVRAMSQHLWKMTANTRHI